MPSERLAGDVPPLEMIALDPPNGSELGLTAPRITIRLSTWIDARASSLDRAFSFVSGSLSAPARATYDPATRSLAVEPRDPLRPGLTYRLDVREELLISVWAEPAIESEPLEYPIRDDATFEAPNVEPPPRWADVSMIFEARCSCHYADASALVRLEPDTLFDAPTRAYARRRYVVPSHPGESYLVEKLLPEYPDRYLTRMPPPWAQEGGLDAEELQVVVDWIAGGAR